MFPSDQPIRSLALDPTRSFIVQAPAGSGKTGLLIQRYLTLLAEVENPEEVIAVTFTRKAVGEMRERILMALENAQGEPPSPPFDRHTWELARKVASHDTAQGWDIRAYPARLRIQTIDSLCAWITREAPWRSRFGGEPRTVEDAEPLYRQAVHDLLERLENGQASDADALACVLESLDNDLTRFEATLTRMLARRDQWLRHLTEEADSAFRRQRMTRALERTVRDALASLRASVPPALSGEIVAMADYAGANIEGVDPHSPLAALAGLDSLPGDAVEDVALWQGIAALLLTQAGEWRSRYTKKEGFPAKGAGAKASGKAGMKAEIMKERVAALQGGLSDAHTLRTRLHAIRELPRPVYDDRQWAVLDALITVLRLASAALRPIFAEHGVVDFIEVAQGALSALAEEDSHPHPALAGLSPLIPAFSPDYPIHHLLVDEFQDTSHAQVLLFTRLTAHWRPFDGHTLFLVGDPMQSIYRFREADVGLYLRAWRQGIGNIPLEPLTLSANFRARDQLVAWINETFPSVFPDTDDPGEGAVCFTPSVAHKKAESSPGVSLHAYPKDQGEREAAQVVALIQAAKRENPTESVAVLVRTRAHLEAIIPHLQAARIWYRGVEIASLAHRQVVQDLLALTRALLHPGDRVAWLSVLRAPWCGLTLHDLHALVEGDRDIPIPDLLRAPVNALESAVAGSADRKGGILQTDPKCRLSPDGRVRAGRVFGVLDTALRDRARKPLRAMVEGVWVALGGPACIDAEEIPDTEAFFALLDDLEAEVGSAMDGPLVAERISRLYATPDATDWQVEIMTIHKAKGLEFDTVILPGLERGARAEEKPLLAWAERPTDSGDFELVLAPMTTPGDPEDPIYRHLCLLDTAKTDHEAGRLLYVAATRARRYLHLLCQLETSAKENAEKGNPEKDNKIILAPNRRSLLARLWPAMASEFTASLFNNDGDGNDGDNSGHVRMDKGLSGQATGSSGEHAAPDRGPDPGANPIPLREPPPLQRLPTHWTPPEAPPPLRWSAPEATLLPPTIPALQSMESLWTGNVARSVGTLLHRILRHLAEDKTRQWRPEQIQYKRAVWRAALRGLGVSGDALESAADTVIRTIIHVIRDPRWHWILDPDHLLPRNEYPLTGIIRGRMINGVIDRTFIDIQGARWIIDYKTGSDGGGGLAEFLDREQLRYRDQLERYADLFKGLEFRPIRAGLYFPLCGGWRTWEIGS